MKWLFVKEAYTLGKKSIGDSIWIDIPSHLDKSGKVDIYKLSNFKSPISSIKYDTFSDGNKTIIKMSLNDYESEISIPRHKSLTFIQRQLPKIAASSEGKSKKDKIELQVGSRVRIIATKDMDYCEAGWIIGKSRKTKTGKRLFLVLVDGSSIPKEYPEEWIVPVLAGLVL